MATINRADHEVYHSLVGRNIGVSRYGCSTPIEGLGIKWHGAPNLYLHKECARRMVGGLLQDIHHIAQLEREECSD